MLQLDHSRWEDLPITWAMPSGVTYMKNMKKETLVLCLLALTFGGKFTLLLAFKLTDSGCWHILKTT